MEKRGGRAGKWSLWEWSNEMNRKDRGKRRNQNKENQSKGNEGKGEERKRTGKI